jgi:hypothetical protein
VLALHMTINVVRAFTEPFIRNLEDLVFMVV